MEVTTAVTGAAVKHGQCLVVLDRGWVFVGQVTIEGDWVTIEENVRCVRYWGTTRGLGELVNGPTPNTRLDPVETKVQAPLRALIALIPCKREW